MLGPKHIAYLIAQGTLEAMAGLTMEERTMMFRPKVIAVTTLRRLYLKHGCMRKNVRQRKTIPPSAILKYSIHRQMIMRKLERVEREGIPLLYMDEIVFTREAMQKREWSGRGT